MINSNEALSSLTLFVASSKAEEMKTVKNLLVSILNRSMRYKIEEKLIHIIFLSFADTKLCNPYWQSFSRARYK